MTVCNMTIEGGGRAGMIAPDETTFEYVIGRPGARRRGPERLARAAHRRRRRRSTARSSSTPRRSPRWSPGGRTRGWSSGRRRGARARLRAGRARARLHGPRSRHADRGDQARPRVHRLVHELADRRPAGRRRGDRRPPRRRRRLRDGRSRAQRRSRRRPSARARRGVPRGRLRLARRRLLDVPGHEPGHRRSRRARRVDLEPQLRGPPGARGALAPGLAADGRGGGDRGPFRRHPGVGASEA